MLPTLQAVYIILPVLLSILAFQLKEIKASARQEIVAVNEDDGSILWREQVLAWTSEPI